MTSRIKGVGRSLTALSCLHRISNRIRTLSLGPKFCPHPNVLSPSILFVFGILSSPYGRCFDSIWLQPCSKLAPHHAGDVTVISSHRWTQLNIRIFWHFYLNVMASRSSIHWNGPKKSWLLRSIFWTTESTNKNFKKTEMTKEARQIPRCDCGFTGFDWRTGEPHHMTRPVAIAWLLTFRKKKIVNLTSCKASNPKNPKNNTLNLTTKYLTI